MKLLIFIVDAHEKWSIFVLYQSFTIHNALIYALNFSSVIIMYTYMSLRSSFLEVVPPLFEGHATPLDYLHKNHLGENGNFKLWRKSENGGYLRGM